MAGPITCEETDHDGSGTLAVMRVVTTQPGTEHDPGRLRVHHWCRYCASVGLVDLVADGWVVLACQLTGLDSPSLLDRIASGEPGQVV